MRDKFIMKRDVTNICKRIQNIDVRKHDDDRKIFIFGMKRRRINISFIIHMRRGCIALFLTFKLHGYWRRW